MHWVSAAHAVDATVALYERLFAAEVPGEAIGRRVRRPRHRLAASVLTDCKVEPALADAAPGEVVQFERLGYFAVDPDQPMSVPPHRRPPRRVGEHPEALHLSAARFVPAPTPNEPSGSVRSGATPDEPNWARFVRTRPRATQTPRSVRSWLRRGGTTFDGHEPTNSLGARRRAHRASACRRSPHRDLGTAVRPQRRRSDANHSRPGAPRPLRRSRATRRSTRSASSTPATTSVAGARRSAPAARCGSISPRTFPPTPPPCRCR